MKTAIALTAGIVMPFGFLVLAALAARAVLVRYRYRLACRARASRVHAH